MSGPDILDAVSELLTATQQEELARCHDVEFTYTLPGVARFRGSCFLTAAGPSAVFRLIPDNAVPLETLGLPPSFESLLERKTGLVLVSAPLGSGRTTLHTSILDRINGSSPRHVLSLEAPIELLHGKRQGVVLQREVGRDSASFATGIRSAIRLDVDVLMVGDLPDADTTLLALRAAEAGKLVIAFPAIPGVVRTIERLVELFPPSAQAEVGALLADNLRGILGQILLRRKDSPARVAAHELLLSTTDLVSALRDGDLRSLPGVLEAGASHGMQSMDDSIGKLLQAGAITPEEAHRKATDKARFALSSPA
jgi:twitching motility protein PilT